MPALFFVGAAFGISGADPLTANAPEFLQQSSQLKSLKNSGLHFQWHAIIHEDYIALAENINLLAQQNKKFCVIGGDHSCAVGTWSGASEAIRKKEQENSDLGLIWVDAHMDAHTPETSISGRAHGMPVAALLGHGEKKLTQLLSQTPKIKPENLCLVGIRSFEPEEKKLLDKLGVKIFYMADIEKHGLEQVMMSAYQLVTKNTQHFGVSIDLDGLDPEDAPGTGTPVNNGIDADELISTLKPIAADPRLIGYEIAEFSPQLDKNHKTIQQIINMIKTFESI